ncbi:hypothetical protein HOE425_333283 [Hoeflea sp. EC-HK425]|nr:hypothetical protein HOE425_333283 [Hoeflea sp. EC-HK425]
MKHKHVLLHFVLLNLALMVVNEQAFKWVDSAMGPDASGAVASG